MAFNSEGKRTRHVPVPLQEYCTRLQTQLFRVFIWARNLKERIHVTNGRDKVGDKASQRRVKVNVVGFVAPNVLEQVLDLRRYVEVCIVRRIVRPVQDIIEARPGAVYATAVSFQTRWNTSPWF